MEKKTASLANGAERLDSSMQKNVTGLLSYTIHKNKFKMDERPKCETGNHQNPRGENRKQPPFCLAAETSYWSLPEARAIKAKMNYWDLSKIKAFCAAK